MEVDREPLKDEDGVEMETDDDDGSIMWRFSQLKGKEFELY
jgi:hypothetical protein